MAGEISDFVFACAWCGTDNDSLTAEWCSCVSSNPSLDCKACGRCFCKADRAWRERFLTSPAAAVHRRRSMKLSRSFAPAADAPAVDDLPRPIILVVDDDKVVHVIAKRVLAEFNGTLLHAADGEAGLRLAQQLRPDLVITDAFLPKLDGRELSQRLKTAPETQHCKVAVMTALYKGLRYRAEAIRQFHVDAYVEKPLTADVLRKLAADLLTHNEAPAAAGAAS
jgi:CheY-like chemotaxis protein